MSTTINKGVRSALRLAVAGSVLALSLGGTSPVGAAPSCNSADFTTGDEFDLAGYLACLSGGAVPEAGSNVVPLVGVAAGLVVIGLGVVGATVRRRRTVAA